jgi:hypothetical protein
MRLRVNFYRGKTVSEHNVTPEAASSQVSPLDLLVRDLGEIRRKMFAAERRRKSGVLAGQLLILARSYQQGKRPSRRTLKRFFYFVAREAA